jgi:superfamily II DNA or RNA helicase
VTAHELRPYQRVAVDKIAAAWARGVRRPAIVMATGAGKTQVFCSVIEEWLARSRAGRRALVLAHRDELVQQAYERMRVVAPALRTGVVMATRNETLSSVVIGSVQTLAGERRRAMLRDVGLIVVDECHRATAPTYRRVLAHYGALSVDEPAGRGLELGRGEGDAVALGVTATMTRADGDALGDVWQDVVYRRDIAALVEDGYLVKPRGIRVRVDDLDLARVRTTRGDYAEGELGRALEESMAPKKIAEAYREHAADRQGLLFAPTVHSAGVIADALREEGFSAALVHGGTPKDERRRLIAEYRAGRIQILCNCGVFTEGTDLPMCSCVVIARPTKSNGLYIQMCGRAFRLWPGKADGLILDVVGATARHSLQARVDLFGEREAREIEQEEIDEDDQTGDADGGIDLGDGGDLAGGPDLDGDAEAVYADGELVASPVDLFHGSAVGWLTTNAGVWFLPADHRLIAVLPGDPAGLGGFDVVAMDRYVVGQSEWVVRGCTRLADAMAHAEDALTSTERRLAKSAKSGHWRNGATSAGQQRYARQLGIAVAGQTAGELSTLISVAQASGRIDPYLPSYVPRG